MVKMGYGQALVWGTRILASGDPTTDVLPPDHQARCDGGLDALRRIRTCTFTPRGTTSTAVARATPVKAAHPASVPSMTKSGVWTCERSS